MRVVAVTRLFPNPLEPLWCPFNKQQFAALGRLCDVEVLGVIPWFPGARAARRWSAAGKLVDVPAHEVVDGLRVAHPRYLLAPKLPSASATLYAASLRASSSSPLIASSSSTTSTCLDDTTQVAGAMNMP